VFKTLYHLSKSVINSFTLSSNELQSEDEQYREELLYLKDASHDIWGELGLETFGADLELVKQLPATHVWTVVDCGDTADQWILTGIHTVNCICYLVTEVPHDWKDIQFESSHLPYRTMRSNTHFFA